MDYDALHEILKGLTDIPLVLLALIFSALLTLRVRKVSDCAEEPLETPETPGPAAAGASAIETAKKKGSRWSVMFFCSGIAALMGVLAHAVPMEKTPQDWIWTVLYIFLFGAIYLFQLLMLPVLGVTDRPTDIERRIFCLIKTVFFGVTVYFRFDSGDPDIFIFIGFAALVSLPLLYLIFFKKRGGSKVRFLIILLAITIVFQILRDHIPYSVPIEHLFILISLFQIYRIAVSDMELESLT